VDEPPAQPENGAAGGRFHLRSGHGILIFRDANAVLLFRVVVRGHVSKGRELVPYLDHEDGNAVWWVFGPGDIVVTG
jgi:hypothetical protein